MITTVIFDLDGTLVDSEPIYWAGWRHALLPLGMTLEDHDFTAVMGMRSIEVATHFLMLAQSRRETESEPTELISADSLLSNHRSKVLESFAPALLPGALRAIHLAKSLGLRTAIATSAPPKLAELSVKGADIAHLFEVIVSAEHEPYGKPHPGIFLTTAEQLGVEPTQCVVIEDAPNGVIAAKAARMHCIAVPHGQFSHAPAFAIADVALSSLEQLTPAHLTKSIRAIPATPADISPASIER